MPRANFFGVLILSASLSLPAASQRKAGGAGGHPPAPAPGNHQPGPGNHQPTPGNNTASSNQNQRKQGDWLQQHKDLPPALQEKELENDPGFKKLSPEGQAQLRERLRKFNNLPPEQRERIIQRMQFMGTLTQEQRQHIHLAEQQFQALPDNRKAMLRGALRNLRQMPPEERQRVMQSDRFRSTFSDQEQTILKQLSEIPPPEKPNSEPPK